MRQAWTILVLGLAIASTAPARAECAREPGNCQLAQTQWNRASFGAIAYSAKTGAWGAVSGKGSEQEAKEAALGTCAKRSEGCEVVDVFSNTCAAVAAPVRAAGFAVAHSDSRGKAENAAMADCSHRFGSNCRAVASACSLP